MDLIEASSTQPSGLIKPCIYSNLDLPEIPDFKSKVDDSQPEGNSGWESEWEDEDDEDDGPTRRPSIPLNETGMPKFSALKKSSSIRRRSSVPAPNDKPTEREWEDALAKSKLEREVYRGALISQIDTTKQAMSDASQLSHALITTKGALEESMAIMVQEIQTQTDQIKNLKETVAMCQEELDLCHKMLDDRDSQIAETEGELHGLERVHSDLMDAREITISGLEKDVDVYQKVFGEMLDEKDDQLAELEEELRVLKKMHSDLKTLRQKEKETNALLESVYSHQMAQTNFDFDAFEKATQALENEYGFVGFEQETCLDLLLTALSSSHDDVEDLRKQIEVSTLFDSTISITEATSSTAADSSMESDESPDATTIQLLQQQIKELEQKNSTQDQTIVSLQQQVNNSDAWKLEVSGSKLLL